MLAPRKTLWSTPPEVIEVAINALNIKSNDVVFDIGAGDGRFLISCAKSTGAHCTGIEINEERVQEALKNIEDEGLQEKCSVITGNALEQDFSKATVFYLYLIPRGLRLILPRLKALGKKLRVITYMAPFPESETPVETFQVNSTKHPDAQWPLFLYDIEPDQVNNVSEMEPTKVDTTINKNADDGNKLNLINSDVCFSNGSSGDGEDTVFKTSNENT